MSLRGQIRLDRPETLDGLYQQEAAFLERLQNGGVNMYGLRLEVATAVPTGAPAANQPTFRVVNPGTGAAWYTYSGGAWVPMTTLSVPAAHVLATTAGIGAQHTVSGLTAGQVLRAFSATDVRFESLPFSNLAGALAYGQLPTGGGTWANGGTLSITGGVTTVAGLTSTAPVSATILDSGSATDLLLKRNGSTIATLSATQLSISSGVGFAVNGASLIDVSAGNIRVGDIGGTLGSLLLVQAGSTRAVVGTAELRGSTDNSYALGSTSVRFSSVFGYTGDFATQVKSPIVDSGSATDLLVKRNAVTKITVANALTTFADPVTISGLLTTSADINLSDELVFTAAGKIRRNTADASDNSDISLSGGGDYGITRGGGVKVFGNESAGNPGQVHLLTGAIDSSAVFIEAADTGSARSTQLLIEPRGIAITKAGLPTDYRTGHLIVFLDDCFSPPTSGAGFLYSEGRTLKWRGNGLLLQSGALTMQAGASKLVPGATSFSVRNNADSADNLLISDAGAGTFRTTATATQFLAPIVDSGSATDLLLKRNAVTKLTLGNAAATFVDPITIGASQVLSTRVTGYTAFTGTNTNRGTAYDTATITLVQLAERVRALQVDLTAHGAIGA